MQISFNNIFKEGTRHKALFLSFLLCAIGMSYEGLARRPLGKAYFLHGLVGSAFGGWLFSLLNFSWGGSACA